MTARQLEIVGARSTQNNRSAVCQKTQMDRRAFGRVVVRLQAQYIRACLAPEIEQFENTFEEILETASTFMVATDSIEQSPSLVIVDQVSVVKTVCHFLVSSNAILDFLDRHQRRTGLPSGGDISLEKQVKDAQALVQELLHTFILHLKAESYPGKTSGLLYDEDVKFFGGLFFHKNPHVEASHAPDPNDDNEDMENLVRYWHPEILYHPLRNVPGNPWHKFFGNLHPVPTGNPRLFRERKQLPFFRIIFPTTISWLRPELIAEYERYRHAFERFRRLPGPRLPEFVRMDMTKRIQRRLSNIFTGWLRYEDELILTFEDLTETPCPEYDLSGLTRPEALNADINAPDLAGIALLGEAIAPVPVFLTGEPRKYCLEFDGLWDP